VALSRIENGQNANLTLGSLQTIARALGFRARFQLDMGQAAESDDGAQLGDAQIMWCRSQTAGSQIKLGEQLTKSPTNLFCSPTERPLLIRG